MLGDHEHGSPGVSDPETEAHPDELPFLIEGRRKLDAAWSGIAPTHLDKRTRLLHPGQPLPGIYRIVHGWALRSRVFSDGRSTAFSTYLSDDIIGLGAMLRAYSPDEVSLLTPCTLRFMERAAVRELWADPAVSLYLAWLLSRWQWHSDAAASLRSIGSARERLASILFYHYLRLQESGDATEGAFVFPLTQQQIGEMIGMTVVHTNRTLRWFAEEEIATIDHKHVVIHDIDRLREIAMPENWIGAMGLNL